jgi:hypothetical protein
MEAARSPDSPRRVALVADLQAFTNSQSRGVHIGGIKKIDSGIERLPKKRERLRFLQDPIPPLFRSIAHAAKTNARYFQTGVSKR